MKNSSTIAVPRWVLAALLLFAGAAAGVSATTLLRGDQPASSNVEAAATTVSTTSTTQRRTTTTTTSTTTTTTTRPTTTSTTIPPPRGNVSLIDFYGGNHPTPNCHQWDLLLVNNSNLEIVELVFEYDQYRYHTLSDYNSDTQQYPPDQPAEYPGPTIESVSIPPYAEQVVSTVTCTPTPVPTNARGYELSSGRPNITYRWPEGSTGYIDF